MAGEFSGKVAVVTGAARGLGRAVAGLLAERGATVVLADIDAAVSAAAAAIMEKGASVSSQVLDVTVEDSWRDLRNQIESGPGHLDILVNNAGGWRYGSFLDLTDADWDWTFALNLKSVLLGCRVFAPTMIAQASGRIVNVASTDAYVPKPTLPHYAAAKAGVVSLTKSIAQELAPHGVLVNAVSPGAIATETAKSQGWLAERAKRIPLGHPAEPDDIAEAIAYLASPRNRFAVGETIVVNGGLAMI